MEAVAVKPPGVLILPARRRLRGARAPCEVRPPVAVGVVHHRVAVHVDTALHQQQDSSPVGEQEELQRIILREAVEADTRDA